MLKWPCSIQFPSAINRFGGLDGTDVPGLRSHAVERVASRCSGGNPKNLPAHKLYCTAYLDVNASISGKLKGHERTFFGDLWRFQASCFSIVTLVVSPLFQAFRSQEPTSIRPNSPLPAPLISLRPTGLIYYGGWKSHGHHKSSQGPRPAGIQGSHGRRWHQFFGSNGWLGWSHLMLGWSHESGKAHWILIALVAACKLACSSWWFSLKP